MKRSVAMMFLGCAVALPAAGDDILSAARRGDVRAVKAMLAKDPKLIAAADPHRYTALHIAAGRGDEAMVEVLLAAKPVLSATTTPYGSAALHLAAGSGRLSLVKRLVAAGADLRATDRGGQTVLQYAAGAGSVELASFLLDEKFDVNAMGGSGSTALHAAAGAGKAAMVRFLLVRGADANRKRPNSGSALHSAVGGGHKDVVEILLTAGADPNARAYIGETVLQHAARGKSIEIAEVLIKAGADVNRPDTYHGRRPLHAPSGVAMARFLLAHKADPNLRDKSGRSPLHAARTPVVAGALLAAGGSIGARGTRGETPMHALAQAGLTETMKTLLAKGARADARDNAGRTALHWAAAAGQTAALKLLLQAGVKAGAADTSGRTALHAAAETGSAQAAQVLLEAGADVNARDDRGRTPLLLAAGKGLAAMAKSLLDRKADACAADANGWTPLHRVAVAAGQPPPRYGYRGAKPEWMAVAEALLAAGARPLAENRYGETPLFWARALGRNDLAGLLGGRPATATPAPAPRKPAPASAADVILGKLKLTRGVGLVLGADSAPLATALAKRTALTIYCIDPDGKKVAAARKVIVSAGMYGRVSARAGPIDLLAYPDNSANLVLCIDASATKRGIGESRRVLSPNGVAVVAGPDRKGLKTRLTQGGVTEYEIVTDHGVWAVFGKGRPAGSDEWRYRGHDPANTFGSADELLTAPLRLQWIDNWRAGVSSAAMLIGDGRIFHVSLTHGTGHGNLLPTPTPFIQAVDAYTGVELWSRVGADELPILRRTQDYSPVQPCSDVCLIGDALYVLGGRNCYVYDAATGRTRAHLPIPPDAEPAEKDLWLYVTCVGETLYGASGESPGVRLDWNTGHPRGTARAVFAIDRRTGATKWTRRAAVRAASPTVADGKLFLVDDELNVRALDAATGREVWANQQAGFGPKTDIVKVAFYAGKLWVLYHPDSGRYSAIDRGDRKAIGKLFADATRNTRLLACFDASTGRRLADVEFDGPVAGVSFAGGTIYGSAQHSGGGVRAIDPNTGKLKWRTGGTLRCTPAVASKHAVFVRQIAYPAMMDVRAWEQSRKPEDLEWFVLAGPRSTCALPALPANGMAYIQAPGCHCSYPIRANMALAPGAPPKADPAGRLVKGPAHGKPVDEDEGADPWRTLRADNRRSGESDARATTPMKRVWTLRAGGTVAPLAAANGLVFVAGADTICRAVSSDDGKTRWRYFASGRITGPPSYWRGRVYFGDDDGWVHCLRSADGALIWKFRAALAADRIVGYGGYMSRWPALAGVVVGEGATAYFAAGMLPLEGSAVYAADARTGELRWEQLYKGGRNSFRPAGCLTLAGERLYVSTGVGWPWWIRLDDPKHRASVVGLGGYHVMARRILAYGDQVTDILCSTPPLEYVYHFGSWSSNVDRAGALPIVTDDTVFLRDGRTLTAEKRSAFRRHQGGLSHKTRHPAGAPRTWLKWRAAWDQRVSAIIKVGGTIFTGGQDKVRATTAADGKGLWSAPVSGKVTDLAFSAGRLFVVTDGAEVVCFSLRSD